MQVFKGCLLILKRKTPLMAIYIVIFLAISVLMALNATSDVKKETVFQLSKANVAVMAEEDTPFVKGLLEELGKVATFITLPDETEALQDALYFRHITYILRIPLGFTENFLAGKEALLEKTMVPGSYSDIYIDLSIEKYLNTAKLYRDYMPGLAQDALVGHVASDMAKNVAVTVSRKVNDQPADRMLANYSFNYMGYSLLSVLILGIGTLLLAFENMDIKKRNACAPISPFAMNVQFFLASLVFTLIVWLIMSAGSIVIDRKACNSPHTILFLMNALVFSLGCAAIGFFIGRLVKSQDGLAAVCNVVALGSSFISGVFVPQWLLGKTVLGIARFTPTYWYVKGNDIIARLASFEVFRMKPAFVAMGMQLVFILVFLIGAMVPQRSKKVCA